MKWLIQPNPGEKLCLGALAVAALSAGLIAQSLERLVFVETAQLAAAPSRSVVAGSSSLPASPVNAAGGYSPGDARRNLLAAMRGSITVGDIDGNGAPDLYVVAAGRPDLLLQNTGTGGFRDITAALQGAPSEASLSGTFGDYDRSGRQSLFIVGADGVPLYRNNGNGRFADVTRQAGLHGAPGPVYSSAAVGDFDGDGFIDLLVAIYTDLNRPPAKSLPTFPNDFSGVTCRLYRNNGNGTFTDVTEAAGLAHNPGRARKAIVADFNSDRHPDILLLRDEKPPALYLNRGGWKFVETTWDAGDALTRHAFFEGAVGDLDKDGDLDLVLWSTISFQVLLNRGNATFEQEKSIPPIPPPLSPFGFHGMVADLDDNGFDDVVTVDRDGRLHALANVAGKFSPVQLSLPPGFESGYLTPVRVDGGLRLAAIHSNGRVALLRRTAGL